ncbi:hypothetical protein BL253_37265 [Pseudofrankia asymbiotica]|uniref:Uncharacterized protein n=1 Tax=Pseudofrankia asymbiotica TaxID=1834516 RepID=A0A1V2HZ54_9ACTN|nr:hypothetical protein BL253_37265 [Pseudofrankia asymbiotica]
MLGEGVLDPWRDLAIHLAVDQAVLGTGWGTISGDLRERIDQATDAAAYVLDHALRPGGETWASGQGRRPGNSA